MTRRNVACVILTLCASVPLTGCMPKMTIEQMKADMPERPGELDRLDFLVGEWEYTGEADFGFLDQALEVTSTIACEWANDDWYLVCHEDAEMEELGKIKVTWVWSYDGRAKKYRTWWFIGIGETVTGTATFDGPAQVWTEKGKSRSELGNSTYRGTMRIMDDDTVECDYTQRTFLGLVKLADYKGTMRRKK